MYDTGKIAAGLLIFLALITYPIWHNKVVGQAAGQPVLEKPIGETRCVESTAFMRASHMDLLNRWRDEVVRTSDRIYVASDGRVFNKSLTGTCLKCHANRAAFCDRCHDYAGVKPFCWDCHLQHPEEKK
jgi:hypothetical protein